MTSVRLLSLTQGSLALFLFFSLLICDVQGFNETRIEDLPEQIYMTEGDNEYLGPVLNAFAHLARLGVNVSEICYVLCTDEPSAELYHSLGMNVLWVPSIIEEARKTSPNKCQPFAQKPGLNVLMSILYPLYLRILRSGRRLMTFDSDVIFYQNPQDFFDLSNITDYVAYAFARGGIGSRPFIYKQQVTFNAAPTFWLNPTTLVPWVERMNNISLQLEKRCVKGFHQVAYQNLFYACGLRLNRLGEIASTDCADRLPNLRIFPCPFQKYYAHYAGPGGGMSKFNRVRKNGDWIIGDDFRAKLQSLRGKYAFEGKNEVPFSDVLATVGVEPGVAVSGTVDLPCQGDWVNR